MIKVGEFFRTKNGYIFKLDYYWLFNDNYKKLDIVSHSSNIIDLIQEGDYVNGEKVSGIFNPMFLSWGELPYVIAGIGNHYEPQDIKTIVTKEMMKSIEYIVGDE